ncbi:Uncharacterized protein Adt_42056 [Abeliophyllum distichum]|uniref:Uncharacterized protein n=1 Tax=Abeliophyllum distichum TaxID=126358 RepID=A0ABD1PQK8_9LAMI
MVENRYMPSSGNQMGQPSQLRPDRTTFTTEAKELYLPKIEVDHPWTPMSESLYGFIGDNIIPREKIILVVEVRKEPLVARNFMEFLIIDRRSTYNRILGRSTLKQLMAVTSINHLTMKFPTLVGITTVKEN